MNSILFMCCFLVSSLGMAQETFNKAQAIEIINTFFDGFHKGDTLVMRSVIGEDVTLQSVFADKEGYNHLRGGSMDEFIEAIAKRPEDQKWKEKLLDYKVQIDGNLAHVWTPYEFWLNGNFSHCGANAFTLAKTDDGWKIIHLIDSRRKSSCKE